MGMLQTQPQAQQPQQGMAPVDAGKLQQHVNNIVKAAHAFMYSSSTHMEYTKELKANLQSNPPKVAAAKTAVSIMLLLIAESGKDGEIKMLQKAVLPAGIMIAGEILDFVAEAHHHKASEQDAHDTISLFVSELQKSIAHITQGAQQSAPQATPQP